METERGVCVCNRRCVCVCVSGEVRAIGERTYGEYSCVCVCVCV